MSELKQPDAQEFLDTVEQLQDMISGLVGDAQSLQLVAERVAIEFASENGITTDGCASMQRVFGAMRKANDEYTHKFDGMVGGSKYFLPVDMSEGGNTPCDC